MSISVEAFFLCDSAREYANRVSVLGAFVDVVHSPTLPSLHQICLVARVTWSADAAQEAHTVALELRHDADDETIARLDAGAPAGSWSTDYPDMPIGVNVVAPMTLHLRRPGNYSARLIVDGAEEARRLLKVVTDLSVT